MAFSREADFVPVPGRSARSVPAIRRGTSKGPAKMHIGTSPVLGVRNGAAAYEAQIRNRGQALRRGRGLAVLSGYADLDDGPPTHCARALASPRPSCVLMAIASSTWAVASSMNWGPAVSASSTFRSA